MKSSTEKNKWVYTGPTLVAKGLIARLKEIGINPIERNDQESNLMGGFGGIINQMMVFIKNEDLLKAQPIIDEFLKEIGEQTDR